MPDNQGHFKGIAVPAVPWHRDEPAANERLRATVASTTSAIASGDASLNGLRLALERGASG